MEEKDVPIWKRREAWLSPLAVLLVLGFIIFGISYGLYWFVKWLLFSWLRPFSDSEFLCRHGFHKYRLTKISYPYNYYKCIVCGNEKTTYEDDGY